MQWQNFFSPTSSEYASFFNINSKTIERTKTVEQIDITKNTPNSIVLKSVDLRSRVVLALEMVSTVPSTVINLSVVWLDPVDLL